MGKKMTYRTSAKQIEANERSLGERARLAALRVGNLVPLSLTCANKLLVEPLATDRDRANATKRIAAIGELDELYETLPRAPLHMQKEVAQRIIVRIETDIGREETTPVDGIYRRKSVKEMREEAKEKIREIIKNPKISIEAKKTLEDFLAQ